MLSDLRPIDMRSPARLLLRRTAIVVSVIAVTLLGNLRLHASEAATGRVVGDARDPWVFERVGLTGPSMGDDAVADDPIPDGSPSDEGHFVPAIYAWDPDVRFIYYRHISKWM